MPLADPDWDTSDGEDLGVDETRQCRRLAASEQSHPEPLDFNPVTVEVVLTFVFALAVAALVVYQM